jgi:uncharacterized membrane protein YphA (DoxX/SURF4 family)
MVSFILVMQSSAYFNSHSGPETWIGGLLAVIVSAFLLMGFLTPFVSIFIALSTLGIALSWFSSLGRNLLSENLIALNVIVMAVAIALLGPGAFSLDARLFGRREIIIPPSPNSTKP